MRPRTAWLLAASAAALAACTMTGRRAPAGAPDAAGRSSASELGAIAEQYTRLVLALGVHDADYVDAYYGPAQWRAEADAAKLPVAEIRRRAVALRERLGTAPPADVDSIGRLRHSYLGKQLGALVARAEMLGGRRSSFDEESRALYDVVAPTNTEAPFQRARDELDRALPGAGTLAERYETYRNRFVIPPARLDAVFKAAIAACRERTLRHAPLPAEESFVVEYVTGKPWSAYNWYKGGYHSVIQVNTDLPVYIDRAVDLACHEGYPGHHVYNTLLEQRLVRGRGWVELSVYPLFSPQSLIAEGSANYGIEMAFPGSERVEFERATLFPLAGLDPGTAADYYRVQAIVRQLGYAGNEAARRYLNGEIDRDAAAAMLQQYSLSSRAAAEQRVRFFDRYRSYVINYNLGQDLVRQFVERTAGANASAERRWAVFVGLLASPRLPSDLQ